MKKSKSSKAFLDKIKTITFGTGAKKKAFKPPAWVPKMYDAHGKEMKCVAAGTMKIPKNLLQLPRRRDTSGDDNSFAA